MRPLSWDDKGFFINGEPDYMVSGEFPYFRVPKADWERRMELFRQAGGNTIATYVPWLIHEPEEGTILFGDRDERDLAGFLETAKKAGLSVVLRPGPYQYSELRGDGLPAWLTENYPEICARDINGDIFRKESVSYQHPLFLEKARKYYKAFAEVARPYMASAGGPVSMVQVDNELCGVHIWYGSLDYNPETMGFGKKDGRWPHWLSQRYGQIEELNDLYKTRFTAFEEVMPIDRATDPAQELQVRDYADFYMESMGEYLEILVSWLREDGIDSPICHNSPGYERNGIYREAIRRIGKDFLLGSDHYYALNARWAQNHPTPQYAINCLRSLDMLRAQGMPPSVLELPAGSVAETPPILPGDLYAAYMLNTALGMKGFNYYIFTGGPNFPGTGTSVDIYDFGAPVSAEGKVRDTYYALQKYGKFLHENKWMTRTNRKTSVQVGFCWRDTRLTDRQPGGAFSGTKAWKFVTFDLLFSLICSACAPELVPVDGALDAQKPLLLVCPERMSRREQEKVKEFIANGGTALLMPIVPTADENGRPETLLADCIGIKNLRPVKDPAPFVRVAGGKNVYMTATPYTADLPAEAEILVRDGDREIPMGAEWTVGKGRVLWMGFTYSYTRFTQAELMENLCLRMGAKKTVESSNRNIFTAYWSDGDRRAVFAINLYTCPMKTSLTVYENGKPRYLGSFTLAPMEARVLTELPPAAERMTEADLPGAAEIEKACFSEPWSEAGLAEELKNPLATLCCIRAEGKPVAYGGIQCVAGEGYVLNIGVLPAYRRRGYGKAILNALVSYARGKTEFLSLEVRASNAFALAMYEKAGFERVGVRKNFYNNPAEDAVLMTLKFDS